NFPNNQHLLVVVVFFFQAEDGIRDGHVTGVQTCALPIWFFISEAPEFERWLETERARLKDAASRSAHALIERSEASGDFAAAASWARRAARLTPFDEKLVRHWISLLDRLGDRARAVQVYDEFASRLAQEYEMQP